MTKQPRTALRWAREIPTMLHNGRIDRIGHHVALLVATWANNDGTNAFMSLESVAEAAHATLAETDATLRRLEARGYLRRAVASNGAAGWALPISLNHEQDDVAETRTAKRKKATQERTRKWREAKRVTQESGVTVTQELPVTVTQKSSVTTESVTPDSAVTQGSVTQELGVRDARVCVTPAGQSPIPPLTSIKNYLHVAPGAPAARAAGAETGSVEGLNRPAFPAADGDTDTLSLAVVPVVKPSASKAKASKPSGYTADFEAFWTVYPKRDGKREGKAQAAQEFPKAVKLIGLPALMGAVKAYAASCGEKPPDAVRWLKYRRWEDLEPSGAPERPTVDHLRATADVATAARLLRLAWVEPAQHPDDTTPRVQFARAARVAFIDRHADELAALLAKASS